METPEPSYGDLGAFLRRGLPLALVLALTAGVAAFFLSEARAPTYEARVTLLVAEPNPELRAVGGGVLTPSAVDAGVYAAAATTEGVAGAALARLGRSDVTRQEIHSFLKRVEVRADETRVSSLLHVDVRAGDPHEAAEAANAVAASLIEWDSRRAARSVERVVETLEGQVRGLEEEIAALRAAGGAQAGVDERLAVRASLLSELAVARTLQGRAVSPLELFEAASPPLSAAAPRPLRDALLAAVAAVVLGYALLLVRGAADTRVRSPAELALVSGLPVLGVFPRTRGPAGRLGARRLPREATALLRTNLGLVLAGADHRDPTPAGATTPARRATRLLVSSVDRDASSLAVAMALAESFARRGERTLLLDTDLRKSASHGADGAVGSHASLREHLEHPQEPIRPLRVEVGSDATLDLISSFDPAPFPAELLARGIDTLLDDLGDRYDVVVVAAAPLLEAADALVIAPHVAAIVVTADLRKLERATLDAAVGRLDPVSERVAGIVAVEVDPKRAAPGRMSRGAAEPAPAFPTEGRAVSGRRGDARAAAARARLHHR
jgi:polysaccharide biosynthesis transport protein